MSVLTVINVNPKAADRWNTSLRLRVIPHAGDEIEFNFQGKQFVGKVVGRRFIDPETDGESIVIDVEGKFVG